MTLDPLALLREYQSLVSALMGLTTAVILAPRIAARYARAREYWTRRLDHAREVADFGIMVHQLPEAPQDLFHGQHPDFDPAIAKALSLSQQARLLYRPPVYAALFHLLAQSLILHPKQRVAYWQALTQFLHAETRGDPPYSKVGMLAAVLQLGPLLVDRVQASDALRPAGLEPLAPLVMEWQATVARSFTSALRRYSIIRPWRWIAWIRWEWNLRSEAAQLKRATNAA
jgi:hypothetical protein